MFGNIKKRIKETEQLFKTMQSNYPDATKLESCKHLVEELNELHMLQESYWHARVRANELRDEDENTNFNHKSESKGKIEFCKRINENRWELANREGRNAKFRG